MKQHQAVNQSPNAVIYNLTLDEMAIRKHVECDGKQLRGYIDIGTGIQDDTLPPATTVLATIPVHFSDVDGLTGTFDLIPHVLRGKNKPLTSVPHLQGTVPLMCQKFDCRALLNCVGKVHVITRD